MVIGQTTLAVLSPSAFKTLFSDVEIILTALPSTVVEIRRQLETTLPLTDNAARAFVEGARTRISLARRVHGHQSRLQTVQITPEKVRESISSHGLDPTILLSSKNSFAFEPDDVERFRDVVEGRYFEDEHTGEYRRAERFSRRQ